jgi:hypothetical protein
MKKLQSILCTMLLTLTFCSAAFASTGLISGRNGLISGRNGLISGAPDMVEDTDTVSDILGMILCDIMIP